MNQETNMISQLFSFFFKTKLTKQGQMLFHITNENSNIQRQIRLGRISPIVYRMAFTRVK